MDVVVVKTKKGNLRSSSFHVDFGWINNLSSSSKIIDIIVNGEVSEIKMKMTKEGKGYFEIPIDETEENHSKCNSDHVENENDDIFQDDFIKEFKQRKTTVKHGDNNLFMKEK